MRILVAGFPDSGTGLVRKIIGNHPEILDYNDRETAVYRPESGWLPEFFRRDFEGRKHVVFKWPFHDVEDRTNADRIVYVMRDPLDVFGSLRQRLGPDLSEDHSPQAWQAYAKFFLGRTTSRRHCTIRYEDLVDRDFTALKKLFTWLGLGWNEGIFRVERRQNPIRLAEAQAADRAAFTTPQILRPIDGESGLLRQHLDPALRAVLLAMPEYTKLGYRAQATACAPAPVVIASPFGATPRKFKEPGEPLPIPSFLKRPGIV